tara:strand:+ start:1073 stop:1441 length:369 start_codon:yes stop_codon:yes gene_type:complete
MKSFEVVVSGMSKPVVISSGQNAQDNFDLIDKYAAGVEGAELFWFHLESFSSPHVILEVPAEVVEKETYIRIAAEYTKSCTKKHKNRPNLVIIYTPLFNVVKTENVGEVFFKSNRKVKKIVI